jgi:nucleoside-triphosphatase
MKKKNLLVTGRPGVGKTTLVKNVIAKTALTARGFYTEEIREGAARKGFRIKTLGGREGILAHVDFRGERRVGKYGVDVAEFEKTAIPELEEALKEGALIVVDEIGKMELFSYSFMVMVEKALDSDIPFLGVITERGNGFVRKIKSRPDTRLFTLTFQNRDTLAGELLRVIGNITEN